MKKFNEFKKKYGATRVFDGHKYHLNAIAPTKAKLKTYVSWCRKNTRSNTRVIPTANGYLCYQKPKKK